MTGTNINISDDKDSVDSRVSINGPTEAVKTAQQLITRRHAIRLDIIYMYMSIYLYITEEKPSKLHLHRSCILHVSSAQLSFTNAYTVPLNADRK